MTHVFVFHASVKYGVMSIFLCTEALTKVEVV